jgi:hypothetical protein
LPATLGPEVDNDPSFASVDHVEAGLAAIAVALRRLDLYDVRALFGEQRAGKGAGSALRDVKDSDSSPVRLDSPPSPGLLDIARDELRGHRKGQRIIHAIFDQRCPSVAEQLLYDRPL